MSIAPDNISGSFVSEPPSTITGQFEFTVSVTNNTEGQNYDVDALLRNRNTGEEDTITQLTAQFIGQGETIELDYTITETEIDVPDGSYNLVVVATPTLGGDFSEEVVSTPVELSLSGDSGGGDTPTGQPDISFSDITASSLTGAGGVATLTVSFVNNGDAAGRRTTTVEVNGNSRGQIDVQLGAGESGSGTIEFVIPTDDTFTVDLVDFQTTATFDGDRDVTDGGGGGGTTGQPFIESIIGPTQVQTGQTFTVGVDVLCDNDTCQIAQLTVEANGNVVETRTIDQLSFGDVEPIEVNIEPTSTGVIDVVASIGQSQDSVSVQVNQPDDGTDGGDGGDGGGGGGTDPAPTPGNGDGGLGAPGAGLIDFAKNNPGVVAGGAGLLAVAFLMGGSDSRPRFIPRSRVRGSRDDNDNRR